MTSLPRSVLTSSIQRAVFRNDCRSGARPQPAPSAASRGGSVRRAAGCCPSLERSALDTSYTTTATDESRM